MAKLRRKGATRSTSLFLICTEGAETEPQYFGIWIDRSVRVKVLVTPPPNDQSAPSHVVNHAKKMMRRQLFQAGDEVWIVVDRDRWQDKQLAELHQKAMQAKLSVAMSNPCFELWLLAHFEMLTRLKNLRSTNA